MERLLRSLRAPYRIDGHEIVVTGSVGVTTSANCYETPEEVLRDADIAMYRAKSTARGTYATFDTSMYASALARLESEAELLRSADALPRREDLGDRGIGHRPPLLGEVARCLAEPLQHPDQLAQVVTAHARLGEYLLVERSSGSQRQVAPSGEDLGQRRSPVA